MPIQLYDYGAEYILDKIFTTGEHQFMLFTNNITLNPALSAYDNQELRECFNAASGYGRLSANATKIHAIGNSGIVYPLGIAQIQWDTAIWEFSGPIGSDDFENIVYGYACIMPLGSGTPGIDLTYGTTMTGNHILFADKLTTPFTPANGASLAIDITFQLSAGTTR